MSTAVSPERKLLFLSISKASFSLFCMDASGDLDGVRDWTAAEAALVFAFAIRSLQCFLQ